MTISYVNDEVQPTSSQNVNLKKAIKAFLVEASGAPSPREVCPKCGQPMESVETVFWLYGEGDGFRIRVPVCGCLARNPN
jgi:hypothetical protein